LAIKSSARRVRTASWRRQTVPRSPLPSTTIRRSARRRWAHLRRDFKAHAEGLAAEKEFGEVGLALCERVFWAWEVFQHTQDRRQLKRTIRSLQRKYKPIIRSFAAKRARNKRCRGMARNLVKA
jgi:hypothetical protein